MSYHTGPFTIWGLAFEASSQYEFNQYLYMSRSLNNFAMHSAFFSRGGDLACKSAEREDVHPLSPRLRRAAARYLHLIGREGGLATIQHSAMVMLYA